MQQAKIVYPQHSKLHNAFIVRNMNDLIEYFEYLGTRVESYLSRLMKSGVSPDRWDHMITKSHEGNLLLTALVRCKSDGGYPVVECVNSFTALQTRMIKSVQSNQVLYINDMGGYFTHPDDSLIESEWTYQDVREDTYHIEQGACYMNLENDDVLESRTHEYMKSQGCSSFSYITRLHQYNREELTNIFIEFEKAGGQTIYVYTTGTNVEQMYDYARAALDAGINHFEFEFNCGLTRDIEQFLMSIDDDGIVVELVKS